MPRHLRTGQAPNWSPDGRTLVVNGDGGLYRLGVDGDERVNWFPHPSPDGGSLAYLSFPRGPPVIIAYPDTNTRE